MNDTPQVPATAQGLGEQLHHFIFENTPLELDRSLAYVLIEQLVALASEAQGARSAEAPISGDLGRLIEDFVHDFNWDDGSACGHAPNEAERRMMVACIRELIAEPDFVWAAHMLNGLTAPRVDHWKDLSFAQVERVNGLLRKAHGLGAALATHPAHPQVGAVVPSIEEFPLPDGWADAHNLARNVIEAGGDGGISDKGVQMLAQAILDIDVARRSPKAQAPAPAEWEVAKDCLTVIKAQCEVQPSALAKAIVVTCERGLLALSTVAEPKAQAEAADNVQAWEPVAMLLAEQDGQDPHQLIWEGNPPEPYGEVWCKYEFKARQIAELFSTPAPQAREAQAEAGGVRVPDEVFEIVQRVYDNIEPGAFAENRQHTESIVQPYLDAIMDELHELDSTPAPQAREPAEPWGYATKAFGWGLVSKDVYESILESHGPDWAVKLYAPAPQAREPVEPVAWLIERKASRFGPAAWWAGCGPLFSIDDDRCWTQDANMAIKFVDAQSARHAQWTLLRMARQTARDGRLEVTEHMWPAPSQAEPAQPQGAGDEH